MLPKNVIQKLEDSELIRIFLEFVQSYNLQYQKINKQISYKCHEATWILPLTKATGYGRTQSQAYKHALRNLLQILVQDQQYNTFFISILDDSNHHPKNSTQSSQNQKQYTNIQSMKSCVIQDQDSQKNNHKTKPNKTEAYDQQFQLNYRMSASINNKSINNCLPPTYPTRPSLKENQSKLKYDTSMISNKQDQQHSSSTSKLHGLFSGSKKKIADENQYSSITKKQVHHSKINLNALSSSSLSVVQGASNSKQKQVQLTTSVEDELKKAREKMHFLEKQLAAITQQNNILRVRLQNESQSFTKTDPNSKIKTSGTIVNKNHRLHTEDEENNRQIPYKLQDKLSNQTATTPSKVFIPKLKLDILPNYHKKSQKSLNDSLLAVYNEKHGNNKKII